MTIIKVLVPGIPGPPGDPGPAGEDGPPGVGSEWHSGSGAPGVEIGGEGDYYLDINNGDIYGPKVDDDWGNVIFSILEGQQGQDGQDGQDGIDGREVELQKTATHIQWRYVGDSVWTNLVALIDLKGEAGSDGNDGTNGTDGIDGNDGADGREIELRTNLTHVQWRYVGDASWINLIDLYSLKGVDGSDGREVEIQKTATHIQWRYSGGSWQNLVALSEIKGDKGDKGDQGDQGLKGDQGDIGPSGVVTANSPLDYDPVTKTLSFLPEELSPSAIGAEIEGAAAAVETALNQRLDDFRDVRTYFVSKRITASDSNNGTSPGEPFLTIGAAVNAANTYRANNPTELVAIEVYPGTYTESNLPIRIAPNILLKGVKQRAVKVKPVSGQELNSIFAVDSGVMITDFTFSGHQASGTSELNSTQGQRSWAITFNELANNGQGVILYASPYIKDCASITAEDDAGLAGSTSTGDCGGGVEIDGAKCHPNSPLRSMVIYGFTQMNLGGPGAVVKNDGYGEFVSFFGLFGTWHVRAETGGQATLSGGGCSEFGIRGLVADGYSSQALFTGQLRIGASQGATTADVVALGSNRLGSKSRPSAGQVMIVGGEVYVVQSSIPIDSSGTIVSDGDITQAGYRVNFYNPTGIGPVSYTHLTLPTKA